MSVLTLRNIVQYVNRHLYDIFLGDVDRDGYDDILIGAPQSQETGETPQRGASYLLFGKEGKTTSTVLLTELNQVFVVTSTEAKVSSLGGYAISVTGELTVPRSFSIVPCLKMIYMLTFSRR